MNLFRLIGDFCHFMSIIMIIRRVHVMRSCRGLSLKSRAIYLAVFLCRYVDLFFRFVSYYNTFMKVFYIFSSVYILYLMLYKFRAMDEEESTDTFPVVYILVPCIILSLVFNYRFSVAEILWSLSIFLESVAVLPQLHMLQRTGQAEALTRYYILFLGLYRAFYIPNWILRYFVEGILDPIAVSAGIIQTILNFYFIAEYLVKYPREADIEAPEHTRSHAGVLPPDVVPQLNPSIIFPGKGTSVPSEPVVDQDEENSSERAPLVPVVPLPVDTPSLSLSFPENQATQTMTPDSATAPVATLPDATTAPSGEGKLQI